VIKTNAAGKSCREIAEITGISTSQVSDIVKEQEQLNTEDLTDLDDLPNFQIMMSDISLISENDPSVPLAESIRDSPLNVHEDMIGRG
jgi:hypothetical protein